MFYTITAISFIVVKIPAITEMGQAHHYSSGGGVRAGGGDPDFEMEDCFYNQTGKWCPSHVHQAIEVVWLIIMDVISVISLFYLFKQRDRFTGL